MPKRSVKRVELKHKTGSAQGNSASEEIWIQFFNEANRSLATAMIMFRSREKQDDGTVVYSARLHYEGKHILRQHTSADAPGRMLTLEFDKLVEGFDELGFVAGKPQKSSEHKGDGAVESVQTVKLIREAPVEMEIELPAPFITWALALAEALADESNKKDTL